MGLRIAVSILACLSMTLAQVNTGSIQGFVTDPSSASIPGATVRVKNIDRGTELVVTTNEAGLNLASALVPGRYELEVSAPGFTPARLSELLIQVGDQFRQDFTLEVGAVRQAVEVRAEAPMLQTLNASLVVVIDRRKILDMPMLSRDVRGLMRLVPGVSGGGRVDGAARAGV